MERESELLALTKLEEQSRNYRTDGKYLEALKSMEQELVLKQRLYGPSSENVWKTCKAAGELCNLLSMTCLQQENFSLVLELLNKAEILTERDPPGRAATYNNFACYYRRIGKLRTALNYLQKALKIESKLTNIQNPADTHINACAIYSQLGNHETALEHAVTSLLLLQDELLKPKSSNDENDQNSQPQSDRIAVLAIAYHNTGVEQEFLKQTEQSIVSYQKGVEVASRYLSPDHPITVTLQNSLDAANKSIEAKKINLKKSKKNTTKG